MEAQEGLGSERRSTFWSAAGSGNLKVRRFILGGAQWGPGRRLLQQEELPASGVRQTTPFFLSSSSSSLLIPHSDTSTSLVCCPSVGGALRYWIGDADIRIGFATVGT